MLLKIDDKTNIKKIDKNQRLITREEIAHELQVNPFGRYLLELKDGKIIAYLYYSDIYDRAEINQIEVETSYRNQKIATKLLQEMLKNIKKDITLEVRKDNFPAIHLYKKFGFKKTAIRQSYYQGTDGILMERKNGDSY